MEKSTEQYFQPQLFETEFIEGLSNQSFLSQTEAVEATMRTLPAQFAKFLMKQMCEVK